MVLYLSIILGGTFLIALGVSLGYGENYLVTLGFTALAVVVIMLIDGIAASIARLLPAKCAEPTCAVFTVSAKEKKFYEKLKIRKWKERIPAIKGFTGFNKDRIEDAKSLEYVERFLLECCYGELGHFGCMFLGFLILLFFPLSKTWVALSIPVAVVNAILHLLPITVLRYNAYKLEILRKNIIKKRNSSS